MHPDGNTFLYDGASRGLRVMPAPHSPKNSSVFLTVGDGLYILEKNPGADEEDHSFEALIHHAPSDGSRFTDENWYWRSLPPPPYAYEDYECQKVGDYYDGRDPYARKKKSARIFRENRKSCFSLGSDFFTYRPKFLALLNPHPNQIGAAKYQATPLPSNTKSYSYFIPHLSQSLHNSIGSHGGSGGHIK